MGVSGIAGIDTRRLTRILRDTGAMPGAFGSADHATLLAAAGSEVGTTGVQLVEQVTTKSAYVVGSGHYKVVAYDFGIKSTILRCLSDIATVTVVPASTSADEVRALSPHGVFLSNGPGDPAATKDAVNSVKQILAKSKPMFGICMGHQILARANDIPTFKMHHGHRGLNHPVKNLVTGLCEITTQNHGFGVDPEAVRKAANVEITHVNLNDDSIEGIRLKDRPAFSVQYHPESTPGPHDSRYLFDDFINMIKSSLN